MGVKDSILISIDVPSLGHLLLQLGDEVLGPGSDSVDGPLSVIGFMLRVALIILTEDQDGREGIDPVLDAQRLRGVPGTINLAKNKLLVRGMLLPDGSRRLLPHRRQLLAPMAPRGKEVDDHHIVLMVISLEIIGSQRKSGLWALVSLIGRVPDFLLLILVPTNTLALVIQPHLAHPSSQPSVVGTHEIGGIHRGILALESRKRKIEIHL
mmetsp:Transcript_20511/g.32080  ORF Transcript_20511/g.32080 Transcript_20511/m.32080 type:complete len:210 (-) Transcript_20511:63-692(-)